VDSVARTAEQAASLKPDRISVFGYAHVPWFKKHQKMINDAELPGVRERYAQATGATIKIALVPAKGTGA
jgi:oxygen-independent coproporphyrinogen-3 oxidase